MQNFLDVYCDPQKIRALLEGIQPIAFAQIEGQIWTTTGEINKFAGQGAGQRVTKGLIGFAGDLKRIEDAEEAAYFAVQMGKPQGAFNAAMAISKFIHGVPPEVALCAIACHGKSDNATKVRKALGLPEVSGIQMISQMRESIELDKPHPSWGYTRKVKANDAETPKIQLVAGSELSGLLQACLAEELLAKGRYDKALAAFETAKADLEEAMENTKAITRATEIAEKLAKQRG